MKLGRKRQTQKCHMSRLTSRLPQRQRPQMKHKAAVPLAALGRAFFFSVTTLTATAAFAEASPPRPPMDLNPPAKSAAQQTAPSGKKAVAATNADPAPFNPYTAIEKANAYFNGISTLVGDFTQLGGDGRRLGGKLYLSRPGKLRFEYEAPATLEIIADGTSVAVRDRKLATQDLYTIGQTPLKFLLSDKIDITRDLTVTGVTKEPEGARITLEDRSTLGGTSKITLFFDPAVETLAQWRVVDPQGFLTAVTLSNLERGRRMDPKLFVINYQRMDANPR